MASRDAYFGVASFLVGGRVESFDFFLGVYFKNNIYAEATSTIADMKDRIIEYNTI